MNVIILVHGIVHKGLNSVYSRVPILEGNKQFGGCKVQFITCFSILGDLRIWGGGKFHP